VYGSVAGKLLPFSESPIVPESFSTIVTCLSIWVIPWSISFCGMGISPIRNAPAMPFGTWIWASWCEWYMPTAGSRASNS